jgi:hypothetical protein
MSSSDESSDEHGLEIKTFSDQQINFILSIPSDVIHNRFKEEQKRRNRAERQKRRRKRKRESLVPDNMELVEPPTKKVSGFILIKFAFVFLQIYLCFVFSIGKQ